jgi:hypothetical protein
MVEPRRDQLAKRHKDTSQLEGFAEDLGRLLGTAAAKADQWMAQRHAIVKQLTDVRDTASKLLADLGQRAQARVVVRGRGRLSRSVPGILKKAGSLGVVNKLRGSLVAPVVRKRRKMSKAARAKISAAQKARWAKQKAGEKK